jgi:crotonobetainyl-CoA:carnitine CoA-transferase CaiB-like acyl-CoA transferase
LNTVTCMQALAGVVIADFTRVLAGPLATMVLGDLGATVVKVERPEGGDDTRAWGPPYAADGASTYFHAVNRNKRSLTLDLATPAGLADARALAARADVLVENFRPGTMARLGLGYDHLTATNPGLVYCAVSGFGTGAGAALPGYDPVVQALGGLMSVTGPPGEPSKSGVALVDVISGLYAVVGILAALRERDRTGHGQRVEIDLLTCELASLANLASAYLNTGVSPRPMGNAHPNIVPYQTFETADRPLMVGCGTDRQWRALAALVERPDLPEDPRYATNADRVAHRDTLIPVLAAALATRTATEWSALLAAAGIPCGAVNDLAQAFALADSLGLEPVVEVGGVPQVASPLRLSGSPVRYERPPPALGADTEDLLSWLHRTDLEATRRGTDDVLSSLHRTDLEAT